MNGSDEEFARKIIVRLDQAADRIPEGVAYRLQQARARALDGQLAPQSVPGVAHATAGGSATLRGGGGRSWLTHWWLWVGIAVIAAAAFGAQQWRAYRQLLAYEELDAQILSSDLPIDAYLDRGFDAWLKSSSSE
jgi:hypothetical protein